MALANMLDEFKLQTRFYEKQAATKQKLTDVKKLKNKQIERGSFVHLMQYILQNFQVSNFPSAYDVRLVNRVEGTYNTIPLEISLFYVSGPRLQPGVYGTFLSRKHETGCPAWETEMCDQAKTYAGYLLSNDNISFGATVLLPEASHKTFADNESGPSGNMNYCLKVIHSWSAGESVDEISNRINGLREGLQTSGKKMDLEIKLSEEHENELRAIIELVR